jgi:hypothetical protein
MTPACMSTWHNTPAPPSDSRCCRSGRLRCCTSTWSSCRACLSVLRLRASSKDLYPALSMRPRAPKSAEPSAASARMAACSSRLTFHNSYDASRRHNPRSSAARTSSGSCLCRSGSRCGPARGYPHWARHWFDCVASKIELLLNAFHGCGCSEKTEHLNKWTNPAGDAWDGSGDNLWCIIESIQSQIIEHTVTPLSGAGRASSPNAYGWLVDGDACTPLRLLNSVPFSNRSVHVPQNRAKLRGNLRGGAGGAQPLCGVQIEPSRAGSDGINVDGLGGDMPQRHSGRQGAVPCLVHLLAEAARRPRHVMGPHHQRRGPGLNGADSIAKNRDSMRLRHSIARVAGILLVLCFVTNAVQVTLHVTVRTTSLWDVEKHWLPQCGPLNTLEHHKDQCHASNLEPRKPGKACVRFRVDFDCDALHSELSVAEVGCRGIGNALMTTSIYWQVQLGDPCPCLRIRRS